MVLTKKIVHGAPGAGKTHYLVNLMLEDKASMLLSYNVQNIESTRHRLGPKYEKVTKTMYGFIFSIYRQIANARQRPYREPIDGSCLRYVAKQAIIDMKKEIFLNNVRANVKTAKQLIEATDHLLHLTGVIPKDSTEAINLADKSGLSSRYSRELFKLIPYYISRVREQDAILFSEMLVVVYLTCQKESVFLQNEFASVQRLMVDEVQDLTKIEVAFLFDIFEKVELDVVLAGDFNQSINSYRGADIEYLKECVKNEQFETVNLVQTHRFGSDLAYFANQFQVHHKQPIISEVKAPTGLKVIQESFKSPLPCSKLKGTRALLTRNHEHAVVYQMWLSTMGIRFSTKDDKNWTNEALMQTLLGFAIYVADRDFTELPYFLAKSTIRSLLYCPYRNASDEVTQILCNEEPDVAFNGIVAASELQTASLGGLPFFMRKAKAQLHSGIRFTEFLNNLKMNQHFHYLVSGLNSYSVINHLTEMTKDCDITLNQWIDMYLELSTQFKSGNSEFMVGTFHASKGLEYDHVVIAGLIEELFPLPTESIDEATSLFFVALTRAKKTLTLLAPVKQRPSRLLNQLLDVATIR